MSVPLLDLKPQALALESELKEAFDRVLKSTRYILGPEVEELEASMASYSDAKHGIGVTSGTDAILLALMTLNIGPGDEVICPTYTFFATAGCIARVGATPVFVDCCPKTFNMGRDDFEGKITDRTKAVIPVHLFGQMADMDGILELSKKHDLRVIEDSAQSLGAEYKGKRSGGMSDYGTFSFFPSKNLGGFGDGGMLVTGDDNLASRAEMFRNHGASPKYYHKEVGGNFRLDPLQAALLTVKFKHYDNYVKCRQDNAAYYTKRLQEIEGISTAFDQDDARIILPGAVENRKHIWNQYTIRIKNKGGEASSTRDQLKDYLGEKGIGSEIYYPVPMHKQECFAELNNKDSDYPVACMMAEECLSLPIYPELSEEQKDEVIAAIGAWLAS